MDKAKELLIYFAFASATQLLAAPAMASSTSNSFAVALQQYQSGNYQSAVKCLAELVQQSPAQQQYRYLYAHSLIQTNDAKEAAIQYKVCYRIDPNSQCGQMALSALSSLYSQPSQDSPKSLNSAVLSQQLNDLKLRSKTDQEVSKRIIDDGNALAREQEKRIADKTNEFSEMEKLINFKQLNVGNGLHTRFTNYKKEELDSLTQEATAAGTKAIQNAKNQANAIQTAAQNRDALLDSSANNMQSQLNSSQAPGAVTLDGQRSNLFVRSYRSAKPKQPINSSPNQ